VVYQRLYGVLKTSELITANNEIMPYLEKREEGLLVHHIIHATEEYSGSEPELLKIKNSTNILKYMRHPALGWVIIIGTNKAYRMIGAFTYGIFNVRYKGYELDQFDEALAFLKKMDLRLADETFDFSETRLEQPDLSEINR
jgi:hypothetical protein